MSQTGYEKFEKLNKIFTEKFNSAFKDLDPPDKNEIFFYFDNLYRVWYYSALFYDGYAAPADFADIWFGGEDAGFCVPEVKENGLDFKWCKCSIENHPFIKDLSVFAQTVDDGAAFDEITREMLPDDFARYAREFTFADNIYISYLAETALELGLIKRVPAIRIARFASTAKGRTMEQLSPMTALEKVVESAAKIFCRKFSAVLGNCPGLNKALVYDWINSTVKTDDIYADIYSLVGYDIIDLWNRDKAGKEIPDEDERTALSSVYPMGRLIDRYFLTPFGRYLHLIQPIYYRPADIERELEHIFNSRIKDDFDNSYAVFLPSSAYRTTALGERVFKDCIAKLPYEMTQSELEKSLDRLIDIYQDRKVLIKKEGK
ncbi:MAG: hypothetical protein IJR59_03380 [Firmicutes bacterium]|nr:hypothetical protein [Bacillota bacterium]